MKEKVSERSLRFKNKSTAEVKRRKKEADLTNKK
jgi:hypothetical protein